MLSMALQPYRKMALIIVMLFDCILILKTMQQLLNSKKTAKKKYEKNVLKVDVSLHISASVAATCLYALQP